MCVQDAKTYIYKILWIITQCTTRKAKVHHTIMTLDALMHTHIFIHIFDFIKIARHCTAQTTERGKKIGKKTIQLYNAKKKM